MSAVIADDAAPLSRDATERKIDEDLFELTLSRANKAELFEEAIAELDRGSNESASILENLAKWNQSDASRFVQRTASTILDTPFRLIYPSSARSSFDEIGTLYARQYLAISYCWGLGDFVRTNYERHGSWPISKPFVEAILDDKDHPREGIWMDQLCIDQDSEVDKAKSVAAMDIIYRSCIRLVVLLEDVFLDEREANLHKEYDNTQRKFETKWVPGEAEKDVFISFYNKVNAARWWTRAWCLHEFGVNDPWTDKRQCNFIHNATFVMNGPGGSTVKIKWVNLHFIMANALFVLPNLAKDVLQTFNGQYIFSTLARGGTDWNSDLRSSLMARHSQVVRQGSSYLSDRLRVTINMCGLGLAYIGPELDTEDRVLYYSSLLALARGEVYPLGTLLDQLEMKPIIFDDKPTWLCRGVGPAHTSIPSFKLANLKGIHRITTKDIELDMIFFKLRWQVVEDLRRTFAVFPSLIPTVPPTKYAPDMFEDLTTSDYSEEDLDQCRRRFLSGCIINGYAYTSRLWEQLKRDVVIATYNDTIFKDLVPHPAFQGAAQELLRQLLSDPVLPGGPTFTLEDAHLFLTWLADPRSMYYIGAYTHRLQSSPGCPQALVTGVHPRQYTDKGPLRELELAVPADLLGTSCATLRAWILRPGIGEPEDSNWRLVGKALLLGEPDLISELSRSTGQRGDVVSLRKAVVTGYSDEEHIMSHDTAISSGLPPSNGNGSGPEGNSPIISKLQEAEDRSIQANRIDDAVLSSSIQQAADEPSHSTEPSEHPFVEYQEEGTLLSTVRRGGSDEYDTARATKANLKRWSHRLFACLSRSKRPNLSDGYRRIEWICDCGTALYADLPVSCGPYIDQLACSLQRPNTKHIMQSTQKSSDDTAVSYTPTDSGNEIGSEPTTGSSPDPTKPGKTMEHKPQPVQEIREKEKANLDGPMPRETFLALCINTKGTYKVCSEITVRKTASDAQLFMDMKSSYLRERGLWSRLNIFVKPTNVEFIEFKFWNFKNSYISVRKRPNCMPPKHSTEYDFQPRTLEPPPIPPEVFIHYLKHGEGDLNPLRNDWIGHLPKRLSKHDSQCVGYGMHVIEGPNKFGIFLATMAVLTCTVVVAIAYSMMQKDVQGGTGIAALVVASYTSFLTAWIFWRSDS